MNDLNIVDAELALLRAGRDERPRAAARRATARALGLVPRVALLTSVLGFLLRWQWRSRMGYAVASSTAVAIAGYAAYHSIESGFFRPTSISPAIPQRQLVESVAPLPVPPSAVAPAGPVAIDSVPSPSAASNLARDASKRGAPVVRSGDDAHDSVRRQVAALERARAQAESGDFAGALRSIDDYEHRFPDGLFSEEASLLRIEIAHARNDSTGAANLAARFLAAHPSSVHAASVRSLLKPSH